MKASKGAEKFVRKLFVPPIRMVHLGTPLTLEVQLLGIVLEFEEYYSKKCTSHCRHYYYCTCEQRLALVQFYIHKN